MSISAAPLLTLGGSSSNVRLPYADTAPRETGGPFLETWKHNDRDTDAARSDEPWTDLHEQLLQHWAAEWTAAAAAHSAAETKKKCFHRALQIPNVLIPIVLAPLMAGKLVGESSIGVVLALVLSGVAGGVLSVMAWERMSEQHAQAAFRYVDLISDAEEVLAQQRRFRPRCDVTMQRFKMRMDNASKVSPPVSVPAATVPGDTGDCDSSSGEEA